MTIKMYDVRYTRVVPKTLKSLVPWRQSVHYYRDKVVAASIPAACAVIEPNVPDLKEITEVCLYSSRILS